MNDHPSPRRMRVTPIGELGCQNETRGGGGVNAKRDDYWQHVYVAFKPISFVDKFRSERVFRRPLGR